MAKKLKNKQLNSVKGGNIKKHIVPEIDAPIVEPIVPQPRSKKEYNNLKVKK